ncbi:MAG: hypothetical protein V1933_08145, partial [Candidatus Omnitrophota bacterium]
MSRTNVLEGFRNVDLFNVQQRQALLSLGGETIIEAIYNLQQGTATTADMINFVNTLAGIDISGELSLKNKVKLSEAGLLKVAESIQGFASQNKELLKAIDEAQTESTTTTIKYLVLTGMVSESNFASSVEALNYIASKNITPTLTQLNTLFSLASFGVSLTEANIDKVFAPSASSTTAPIVTPIEKALEILKTNPNDARQWSALLAKVGIREADVQNIIKTIEALNSFDKAMGNVEGSAAYLVLEALSNNAAKIDNLAESLRKKAVQLIITSSQGHILSAHIDALTSLGVENANILLATTSNPKETAGRVIITEIGNNFVTSSGEFTRVVLGTVLERAQDLGGTLSGLGWSRKTIDYITKSMSALKALNRNLAQAVRSDIGQAFAQNLGTLREQDIKFHMDRITIGALFANASGNIESMKPALVRSGINLNAGWINNFSKNLTPSERAKLAKAIGEHLLGAGFVSGSFLNNLNWIDMNRLLLNSATINALGINIKMLNKLGIEITNDGLEQILRAENDKLREEIAGLTSEERAAIQQPESALFKDIALIMRQLNIDKLGNMKMKQVLKLMGELALPMADDYTLMKPLLNSYPNTLLRNITGKQLRLIQAFAEILPMMNVSQLAIFAVYGVVPLSAPTITDILGRNIKVGDSGLNLTPEQKQALKDIGIKEDAIKEFKTIYDAAGAINSVISNPANFKLAATAENIVKGLKALELPLFKDAALEQAKAVFGERAAIIGKILPIIQRMVAEEILSPLGGEILLQRLEAERESLARGVNVITKLSPLAAKLAKPATARNWLKSGKSIMDVAREFVDAKLNTINNYRQGRESYVRKALDNNYKAALTNLLDHVTADSSVRDKIGRSLYEGKALKEALVGNGITLEQVEDIPRQITENLKFRIQKEGMSDAVILEATSAFMIASLLTRGYTPFAEQLYAGKLLARDIIVEKLTGEGKTLTSVLALYLHSLTGKGAHQLVTTDAYSKRDYLDTKPMFDALGIKSSFVTKDMGITEENIPDEAERSREIFRLKQEAYNAEVTYVSGAAVAFDILHDLRVAEKEGRYIPRPLNYANVDEIDNIILDQALSEFIL